MHPAMQWRKEPIARRSWRGFNGAMSDGMRQMMLAGFSVSILIKENICSDHSVIEPKANEVISKCNPKPAIQIASIANQSSV
jgi:hypothetical protein